MGGSSIMASAGRVLPLPKGAYSSSTTYHLLDFVSYQGSTYICKQTSTGNAPTNTTYWQIMAQGTESASVAGNYYGTCSTGASTSAKIVSIPATENFVLQVGDIIGIKFDNTNTANNPSLNVNNSGAKPIYYNNSAVSTSNLWASGEANRVTIFMYDGTNWIWMGHDVDIDTDTLSDLKDTTISSASNGQVLMYDSTSSKWKNQTPTTTLARLSDTQISSATDGQVLKYNSTSQKWVNGEDKGGILPHLIIISETGESVVKAVKGTTEIIATETSTGHYECDVPEFGTWTIHAVLNGDDATVNLNVDTVKVYTIDDSHFHGTVTVKYPSGATCRLQSADETLYATGSPYTFTVHHAETYTITVTYNQRIYTDTVTFTTEGQSFSKTLPSPSEIDVINDIDIWLWYGDVSGTFSTLADILGNSTALSMLMSSTDAVDYLVRCKDWIVKEALVPTMTSDTTPSGEAFASGNQGTSYLPYKAFDGDDTTRWSVTGANVSGAYIGYKFTTPVKVNRIYTFVPAMNYTTNCEFKVQGSNDGSTWTDIDTITWLAQSREQSFSIQNDNEYLYYRLYCNSSNGMAADSQGTNHYVLFYTLQFYSADGITDNQSAMSYIGLNNYCANTLLADTDWLDGICNSEYFESVLNVKVPTMTSNTTPSGECFSSQGNAWRAFDGDESTYTQLSNLANSYIGYKFTSSKKINICEFSSVVSNTTGWTIEGSNNGTDYTQLKAFLGTTAAKKKIIVPNANSYLYYRVRLTTKTESWSNFGVYTVQFYGREDA